MTVPSDGFGTQGNRIRRYSHLLRGQAKLHGNISAKLLVHAEDDIFDRLLFETSHDSFDTVDTR